MKSIMKKIIISILCWLAVMNVFNAFDEPYYLISHVKSTDDASFYIHDFEFAIYKYKYMNVYAVHSNDLSHKEKIADYEIPRLEFSHINLVDLSASYYRKMGTLSISVGKGFDNNGICVSATGLNFNSGLCKNNMFDSDDVYDVKPYYQKDGDKVTLVRMNSTTDDSYIDIFIEFIK